MKAILLLLLVMSVLSFEVQQSLSLSDLFSRKKTVVKTDIFGRQVKVVLQQKGSGITDAQQTFALKLMEQGSSIYAEDLVGNAKFIASKIEDAWSGRWNVEIFGGDPSWGRSTHISQDKWLLFFAWGDYELDFIIWAPDC